MNERQREWLDYYRTLARSRGGACLSSEYRNCQGKLQWRCAEGHEWRATANSIRQGCWCRPCANATRIVGRVVTIGDMRELAGAKGGLCLSTEYVNSKTHLRWRCAEGHEWEAMPAIISRGSWCPHCVSTRLTIGAMRELAGAKGGRCLSTEYVNSTTHLRWRCAEGHEWEAIPSSISRGSWCPYCAGMVRTIGDMRELARARGGRCLSRSYRGDQIPLTWRCADGHEWESCPGNIRRGRWCPRCAGVARKTLADVQAIAAEHGGVCLSTSIKSVRDRLRYRCRVGHEFAADAVCLQRGQWCPRCRGVPRGTLDQVRMAAQRRGGVVLDTEYHDRKTRVRVRCREGHEWSVRAQELIRGSWCRECGIASSGGRSRERLSIADMQEVAQSRGGRCLSDTYVNNLTKLRWLCHDGHEWDAAPGHIRRGTWCPVCAYRHRGSIDGMRALAAERGGTCRSPAYQNHNEALRFTCGRGHEFTATGRAVKSGAWCPSCGEWDVPTPGRRRTKQSPTK